MRPHWMPLYCADLVLAKKKKKKKNAAQCSVQVRPGSQQEKRPWRAHPLKSSTKLGRLRCNQVIYVDASTKGKTIQHEDYRPAKHNGCGWECLPYEEHRTHIKMAKGREAREAQRSVWP